MEEKRKHATAKKQAVTERGRKDEMDITGSSTGIFAGSVFWGSQMAVSSGAYHRKGNHIFRKNQPLLPYLYLIFCAISRILFI